MQLTCIELLFMYMEIVARHTQCRSDFGEIRVILHLDECRGVYILLLRWTFKCQGEHWEKYETLLIRRTYLVFLSFSEPDDWTCSVRFSLVRFFSQRKSNCTAFNFEITEKIDAHERKSHRSFFRAIYQCKILLIFLWYLLVCNVKLEYFQCCINII